MANALLQFIYPIAQAAPHITSDYKYRKSVKDPTRTVFHDALDLRARSGSGLLAPADGVVTFSGNSGGACGGQLTIEHHFVDGQAQLRTYYCHLLRQYVRQGDQVKQGQLVGLTGGGANDLGRGNSRAAHLHFVVQRRDAVGRWRHTDPKPFMHYALQGMSPPVERNWLLIGAAAVASGAFLGSLLRRQARVG